MAGEIPRTPETEGRRSRSPHDFGRFEEPRSQEHFSEGGSRAENKAINTFIDKGALRVKISAAYLDRLRTRVEQVGPSPFQNQRDFKEKEDVQIEYQHFHHHIRALYGYSHESMQPPEVAIEAYKAIQVAYNNGIYHSSIRQRCKSLGFPFAQE